MLTIKNNRECAEPMKMSKLFKQTAASAAIIASGTGFNAHAEDSINIDGSVNAQAGSNSLFQIDDSGITRVDNDFAITEAKGSIDFNSTGTSIYGSTRLGTETVIDNPLGGEMSGFVHEDENITDFGIGVKQNLTDYVSVGAHYANELTHNAPYSMASMSNNDGNRGPVLQDDLNQNSLDASVISGFLQVNNDLVIYAQQIEGSTSTSQDTKFNVDEDRSLGGVVYDYNNSDRRVTFGATMSHSDFTTDTGQDLGEKNYASAYLGLSATPNYWSRASFSVEHSVTEIDLGAGDAALDREIESTSLHAEYKVNLTNSELPVYASVYGQARFSETDLEKGNGEKYKGLERDRFGAGIAVDMVYEVVKGFNISAGAQYNFIQTSKQSLDIDVNDSNNQATFSDEAERHREGGVSAYAKAEYKF